jgi:hypothetical protein
VTSGLTWGVLRHLQFGMQSRNFAANVDAVNLHIWGDREPSAGIEATAAATASATLKVLYTLTFGWDSMGR